MLNGEELKRVRMIRGISQSQMAHVMKIRNRDVISYEQGERNMDNDLYVKWLDALYDEETKNASKTKVNTLSEAKKKPTKSSSTNKRMTKKKGNE